MSARLLAVLAGAGSAAMLMTAWGFQYLGGLPPCPLCIWQRWPHGIAVLVALVVALAPKSLLRPLCVAGALAAAATGGIGIYHTGIERGWWPGPSSCTGAGDALSNLTGADLLSTDAPVQLVMCDQVAWSMLGLSMASWNALAAFGLAVIWGLAATRD